MPTFSNKIFSDEEIATTEELARLFFTPREIALMLQVSFDDVQTQMDAATGPIYEAFQRGRLQSEVDLRKGILQLAKAGSSPAQTMAMGLLNKSTAKMLDR